MPKRRSSENLSLKESILRLQQFVQYQENDQGCPANAESLLAPGVIELLVAQRRAPLLLATSHSGGGPETYFYQVPPARVEHEKPQHVQYSRLAGVYLFTFDGKQHVGANYNLTEDQKNELEQRIKAAQLR